MPVVTQHPPGTPSWVDLSSPDPEASAAFYGAVFGWEAGEAGDPETTGGYRMFLQDGRTVAGLGPVQDGMPVVWSTYVTVADADATAVAVTGAGGAVVVPPFDVLDAGRMAVFSDAQGAVFCIWQPRAHIGAEIVNDPVSLCWSELATTDAAGALAFYGAVFGWGGEASDTPMGTYTMLLRGDRGIGGMRELGPNDPPGVPPNWLVYFAVADCAASAAAIAEHGGTVHLGPVTIPAGTFAVASDPQGAVFAVIQLSPEMVAASA